MTTNDKYFAMWIVENLWYLETLTITLLAVLGYDIMRNYLIKSLSSKINIGTTFKEKERESNVAHVININISFANHPILK